MQLNMTPPGTQGSSRFEWMYGRVNPLGYHVPQELGSTPIYPEMSASPGSTYHHDYRNTEEPPIHHIEDSR